MTRAKSRAIASMIGASESSAEEMEAVKDTQNTIPAPVAEHYLETLKDLGYEGIPPKTSFEASEIIKKLKNGAKESDPKKEQQKEETEWCNCESPKPKFEKGQNNFHCCYHCTKPVKAQQASSLLQIEVNYT